MRRSKFQRMEGEQVLLALKSRRQEDTSARITQLNLRMDFPSDDNAQ